MAVNFNTGLVWLDTDEYCVIEHLYDSFGEETDDMDEATTAIAPMLDGRWIVVDLTQYVRGSLN